jgi:hypothetical protein
MRRSIIVFLVLAFTQITGWGVVGLLPVVGSSVAVDLQTTLPIVFMGTAIMFVTMGLIAPIVGKAFARFGAKRVMALGAASIGTGLSVLGMTKSVPVYFLAWCAMGGGGAMFLTTAAYVYLADFAEERARGMIGTLMLITGLAGSLFWPLTAYLEHLVAWRTTTEIYAGGMVLLVAPLVLFGLPEVRVRHKTKGLDRPAARRGRIFWLLVIAIALNSFVTFGMEANGIELFRVLGADPAWAVGLASFLGLLKVFGRLIDLAGGKRWDALSTGIVSAAMVPAGLLVLLFFGATTASVLASLILFGIGSGAFAVARATMPLIFYKKAEYAATMSTIALPMNLSSAMAAPILSGILTERGAGTTLALLVFCSGTAFCLLLSLSGSRTREMAETPYA